MVKKKDRKKAAKAKVKAKKKAKQKAKEKKGKSKTKKVKTKEKKTKIRGGVTKEINKKPTPVAESSQALPIEDLSMSVNAKTAISIIRSLKTVDSVNKYIEGDERSTVKKIAASKIRTLLKELY